MQVAAKAQARTSFHPECFGLRCVVEAGLNPTSVPKSEAPSKRRWLAADQSVTGDLRRFNPQLEAWQPPAAAAVP